jgi:hypothetical protein
LESHGRELAIIRKIHDVKKYMGLIRFGVIRSDRNFPKERAKGVSHGRAVVGVGLGGPHHLRGDAGQLCEFFLWMM